MGRNQRRETTTRPAALSQRKSRQRRPLYDKNVQAKPSNTGHTLKHYMKRSKKQIIKVIAKIVECRHGRVVKSIEFKFWWLSHRSVVSNPGHDTCVLEQDTLQQLLLISKGYKWVLLRVEVDIVNEKVFGAPRQLGAAYSPGS